LVSNVRYRDFQHARLYDGSGSGSHCSVVGQEESVEVFRKRKPFLVYADIPWGVLSAPRCSATAAEIGIRPYGPTTSTDDSYPKRSRKDCGGCALPPGRIAAAAQPPMLYWRGIP
jgi:hypothetical protein